MALLFVSQRLQSSSHQVIMDIVDDDLKMNELTTNTMKEPTRVEYGVFGMCEFVDED